MFVVFDLETTGFSELTCDVIEFAYIMFDDNKNVVKSEQLYFYYKGMSWGEDAYKVHGIPLSFLETHKDKFKENLIKMYTVLNHSNVVGHNIIKFDCPFAKTWLMRQGIKNLEFGVIQDTMKAFKPIYKSRSIKLTKLAEICKITDESVNYMLSIWFPGAKPSRSHEAAFDVVQTALITLQGLNKRLIMFEPLIKDNVVITDKEMSSMYEESTITNDPNRFLVKLSDGGITTYHFINHDYSSYVDLIPTETDISNMEAIGRLFPLEFEKTEDGSYEAEYNGVTYCVIIDKDTSDTFLMKTPYITMTDTDFDIIKIIRNNFNTIKEGDVVV